MKERSILIIHSGECNLFAHVLRCASEYCKENGYGEALVRNGEHGYEIFVPAATTMPAVPADQPAT